MKVKCLFTLGFSVLHSTVILSAHAQGTAFTYQGELNSNGYPASGAYDLKFSLFNNSAGGVAIAGPVTNNSVGVTNGLFTTVVDVGAGVFRGDNNWLEIAIRANGSGNFSALTPRQQLTPTPYAITAGNLAAIAQFNTVVPGMYATVGGGSNNTANGYEATVSGCSDNVADNDQATVCGGLSNTAGGPYATTCGGFGNIAAAYGSFAAGVRAQALHSDSFVWSDGSFGSFPSTVPGQFSVLAYGGIRFAGDVAIEGGVNAYHHLQLNGGNSTGYLYGSHPYFGDGIHLGYNFYADSAGVAHIINSGGGTSRITATYGEVVLGVGDVGFGPNQVRLDATLAGVTVHGTFNNLSDRNAKQDFAPVSSSAILDEVMQLPISEWSYRDDPTTRHVGPVAQDFHSAFNIGTDDKYIAPIDEGGVALAAIQGLNQKLENEAQEKDAEIRELKQRVSTLDKMISSQPPK